MGRGSRSVVPSDTNYKMRRAHAGRVSMGKAAHQKEANVGLFAYQSLLVGHLVDTMVAVQDTNTTTDNWFAVYLYGSRGRGPSLQASAGTATKFNGYIESLVKPGPAFVLRESLQVTYKVYFDRGRRFVTFCENLQDVISRSPTLKAAITLPRADQTNWSTGGETATRKRRAQSCTGEADTALFELAKMCSSPLSSPLSSNGQAMSMSSSSASLVAPHNQLGLRNAISNNSAVQCNNNDMMKTSVFPPPQGSCAHTSFPSLKAWRHSSCPGRKEVTPYMLQRESSVLRERSLG